MINLTKLPWLVAYYLFARYLPASAHKYGRWAQPVRGFICRRIFKYAGKKINIEKGAYFSDGSQIETRDDTGKVAADRWYYQIVR